MSIFRGFIFLSSFLQYATIIHCSTRKLYIDPQVDWTLEQRIEGHGYPVRAYKVTTEDGYILSLYHISNESNANSDAKNKTSPVLLVHGMAGSPHNFVVLGAHRSLPYYFYDRGYDVWMFSSRGLEGSFPDRHIKYDWDKNKEYWRFSFHEVGIHDLPACIDFILNYTSRDKVALVGHSAAGNSFFAMFSERPEYNDKVTVAISWASSPILKRTDYPLGILLSSLADLWKGLNKILGAEEVLPILQSFKPMLKYFCADPEFQKVCITALGIVGTHKSVLLRPKDIQIIASNLPRLSSKQIYHFMDNFNNGSFRQFNYGPKKNLKIYGQLYPPYYNFSAARAPTAFFLGRHDSIIHLEDIREAVALIPNTVKIHVIPFEKFTHVDFIFGQNATEMVYEPTYELIRDIDNGVVFLPVRPYNYS